MPLRGARTPKTTSLSTCIRTPSGHQYQCKLWPLWAIRTQSSNHPTMELGCTMGHTQSPLLVMHAAILATWLKTNASPLPAGVASDWGFTLDAGFAAFYCVSYPSLCEFIGLLGVSPHKTGNVERHKHVWVNPFRDIPLFMIIDESEIIYTDFNKSDSNKYKLHKAEKSWVISKCLE